VSAYWRMSVSLGGALFTAAVGAARVETSAAERERSCVKIIVNDGSVSSRDPCS
jgi:hypothetical protein